VEKALMQFMKPFAAMGAAFALAGCSIFSNHEASAVMSAEQMSQMTDRTAMFEAEIAGLKEENAQLAGRVEDLERENKELRIANAPEGDSAPITNAALRDTQTVTALKPEPAQSPENDAPSGLDAQDVPVESSPRLVQRAFAATNAVFENEATDDAIATESVLYGVHLASYRLLEHAQEGWGRLQRENPDELGLLEPRVESVVIKDQGEFLRLIGGGFSSMEKAAALCAALSPKGVYCSVTNFTGERLSFAEKDR
jgi:hypothetical protein